MPRQHKGTEEKWVGGKRQFVRPYCDKDARAWKDRALKLRGTSLLEGLCEINRLVPREKAYRTRETCIMKYRVSDGSSGDISSAMCFIPLRARYCKRNRRARSGSQKKCRQRKDTSAALRPGAGAWHIMWIDNAQQTRRIRSLLAEWTFVRIVLVKLHLSITYERWEWLSFSCSLSAFDWRMNGAEIKWSLCACVEKLNAWVPNFWSCAYSLFASCVHWLVFKIK
jgi:hypothetical protein